MSLSIQSFGYTHTQESATTVWTINHNLGREVIVDVAVDFQGAREKILPKSIIVVNENTLRVTFSNPFTGTARVV